MGLSSQRLGSPLAQGAHPPAGRRPTPVGGSGRQRPWDCQGPNCRATHRQHLPGGPPLVANPILLAERWPSEHVAHHRHCRLVLRSHPTLPDAIPPLSLGTGFCLPCGAQELSENLGNLVRSRQGLDMAASKGYGIGKGDILARTGNGSGPERIGGPTW